MPRGLGKYGRDASFTLEAALLMAVILPILVALLLTGFYLHDKGYLQGTAIELAAMGSNLRLDEERDARLAKVSGQRVKGALLWTRNASASAASGDESAWGDANGTFRIPGLVASLLGKEELQVGGKWTRRIYRPAQLIWKIRAAKVLVDDLL